MIDDEHVGRLAALTGPLRPDQHPCVGCGAWLVADNRIQHFRADCDAYPQESAVDPAAYVCNECGYCQSADAPHATTTACHACHMPANWSPLYRAVPA